MHWSLKLWCSMNAELTNLVEKAIREGLTSLGWTLVLLSVFGAGAGALLGGFLQKSGEQLAIKKDFQQILDQLRAQTRATEEVKGEVTRRSSFEDKIYNQRFSLVIE